MAHWQIPGRRRRRCSVSSPAGDSALSCWRCCRIRQVREAQKQPISGSCISKNVRGIGMDAPVHAQRDRISAYPETEARLATVFWFGAPEASSPTYKRATTCPGLTQYHSSLLSDHRPVGHASETLQLPPQCSRPSTPSRISPSTTLYAVSTGHLDWPCSPLSACR